MDFRDVQARLFGIESRLTALERAVRELLGSKEPAEPAVRASPPTVPSIQVDQTAPPEIDALPDRTSKAEILRALTSVDSAVRDAASPDLAAAPGTIESQGALPQPIVETAFPGIDPLRAQTPQSARPPQRESGSLEVMIGTRWVAWAGALLVILAAGFFVKLAYDNGWLNVPPALRCLAAAAFGFGLLGGGEWTLRKINRRASTSLFAAGIGVLYLTAYASCKYFNLVSESAAFGLLALVACLGIGVTLRGRMAIIGAISLVGGYGAPLLLHSAAGARWALPLYMTFLLVVALTLSARRAEVFRSLRVLACALHAGLAALWLSHGVNDFGSGALLILASWWAFVGVELALAAARNQSAAGNAVISGLATAWLIVSGCWVLKSTGHGADCGWFMFVLAATVGAAAFWRGRGLTALQHRPRQAEEMLGVSLWLQCGALLAVGIAAHFSGGGMDDLARTVGWLALGFAGIELGRRLRSSGVEVYGVIVGMIALLKCFVFDQQAASLQPVVLSFDAALWGGVVVTRWALLASLAMTLTLVAGLRTRLSEGGPAAILMTGLALAMWLYVAGLAGHGLVIPLLWLAAWAGLHFTRRWGARQCFAELAVVALAAAIVRWLAMDALLGRAAAGWSATAMLPLWNPQMLVAVLVAAAIWSESRCAAAEAGGKGAAMGIGAEAWLCGGALLMLIALSFELDRTLARWELHASLQEGAVLGRTLWMMLLWAISGFGMLLAGARRRLEGVAVVGWVLVGSCAAVWLTAGTLAPRLIDGILLVTPLLNLQCITGIALLALLICAALATPRTVGAEERKWKWVESANAAAWSLTTLLGLWIGTLELDRAVVWSGHFADVHATRQTAFSVFWGLYGIALVGTGFAKRSAALRYGGLTLLGLTLAKVVLVDMADVGTVYRVLSFLGLGLVLIVTSVTYSKLASRLLPGRAEAGIEGRPGQ